MSANKAELLEAVSRACEGAAFAHAQTSYVHEQAEGSTVWEGSVETFKLEGHPRATECYAWGWNDKAGKTKYTVVMGEPPVISPRDAIQLWILHTDFD